MNDANTNARAQRDASLARLDPNSGAAIAAKQMAAQAGSNQANQQGLDIAANSRKHALAALGQYGNMTNQVRGQNDAISQFNATMANGANRFNAGAQNDASQFGINAKLKGLDAGTGAGNVYATGLRNQGQLRGQSTGQTGQAIGAVGAGAAEAYNQYGQGQTVTEETAAPYWDEDLERDDS